MNDADTPKWRDVSDMLTSYDGAASEIFVIDLPAGHIRAIVEAVATLPDLEVLLVNNESLEQPAPFTRHWRDRLEAPLAGSQHALRSANGTDRHLP